MSVWNPQEDLDNEVVLTMDLECDPQLDEALVEAFQKAYPKVTIEVVDNSPGV